ncbi:MAG: 4-hydroxy-3-methylbut-2-enyl diphosphate reductase [Cyclobacteriaceae bacterium]|nr:4-hydroxy-3-methylbut-2-enyl diphosphate reductase [Cyclobacteriaceae bacterium]
MKKFDIPEYYRSSITGRIKEARKNNDPRKKDFTPTLLDFGPVQFYIARHFGFCYGVENAIEISYKALEENPDKNVYLLSQMIHNQEVNNDLVSRGIKFIMDTDGTPFIQWNELKSDDIVIVPAFGTTIEIEKILQGIGIEVQKYNTTCPFVERVWKRSEKLGQIGYTIIIHGKHNHEETRATFSHSNENAPSLIIRDIKEAKFLSEIISGERDENEFFSVFKGRFSQGFDPSKDLQRVGVVNQTTMLASETQEMADYIKKTIINTYGEEKYKDHFSDTRDTLCYATNDNQDATYQLLELEADLAIVVGGYNSSNTSHIVELCERKFSTYFINSEKEIKSSTEIHHYKYESQKKEISTEFIPQKSPVKIVLTSGASCPDTIVDRVMLTLLSFFENTKEVEEVLNMKTL